MSKNNNLCAIPTEYLEVLKKMQLEKKYGTYTLILQDGKIIGYDITVKERKAE